MKSYRTHQGVGYRYRVRTEPYRNVRYGIEAVPNQFRRVNTPGIRYNTPTEVLGTGVEVIPNLRKYRIPVSKSYRTYRNVGYRYRVRTEPYRSVGKGIEAVPNHFGRVNTPCIRYNTATEVSGTSVVAIPNFQRCRISVLTSYRTYRTVGIEFVPNVSGLFGWVLRPHRTLR